MFPLTPEPQHTLMFPLTPEPQHTLMFPLSTPEPQHTLMFPLTPEPQHTLMFPLPTPEPQHTLIPLPNTNTDYVFFFIANTRFSKQNGFLKTAHTNFQTSHTIC